MTEVLAKDIKVSRTPVRDALRKLETDGLVTIQAHLGASVKKIQVEEYRELCDLRLALESHAAGLAAASHTKNDLREIHIALEEMRLLTQKIIAAPNQHPLLSELARADVRFHIAIMTAAKNKLMKKEILRLHLINRVLLVPKVPGIPPVPKVESNARRLAVLAKHEEIYSAIVAANAMEAKRAMEFHLQELIDHNLELIVRSETGGFARNLTAEELAYDP